MMVYTTAMITAMLAAAFVWSSVNLDSVLASRDDSFLDREMREFADIVKDSPAEYAQGALRTELRHEVAANASRGLFIVIRRVGQIEVYPESELARGIAQSLAGLQLGPVPQTVHLSSPAGGVRVAREVLRLPEDGDWTIEMGFPANAESTTVSSFNRRLAGGGALFLVIAVLGGSLLTRQAMRPVAAAVQSAASLNPDDLAARLPRTGAADELDLLAATINDLLERLARNHEQITRFTADASHELRAPLAAIRASVDVALQQPRSAGDYHEILATLGEQCQRLTDLVNRLLFLARADAGQIALVREPVDLSLLVQEAVETYRPLADEKRLHIECSVEGSIACAGDRMRLLQLVTNLLDNAIKFTGADGTIRLALEASEKTATLIVNDTGIGIAPGRLPHIFERFYQVDESRSIGGGGLGLSICRWVAAAHAGTIEATSEPGRGTCFRVVLPRL